MNIRKNEFVLFSVIFAMGSIASDGVKAQTEKTEMIRNSHFEEDISGWWSTGGNVDTKNNNACMQIAAPGKNAWDVILAHSGVGLIEGESYTINFDAYADTETQFKTLIQHAGPPYTHYFLVDTTISQTPKHYQYEFTHHKASDAEGEFQFQMGAQQKATICFSNVSIVGKPYSESFETSSIHLNQLGFLPKADKFIYVVSDEKQPLEWKLQNQQGINLDIGSSKIYGLNKASGEHLHYIDLSSLSHPQKGLTITINGETSPPFDIRPDLYHTLKYDAFSYFYQNRSGIDIKAEHVQRKDLARPAGHRIDKVSCFNKVDNWGNQWPGCDFEIDVSGGWYDAGDHGKYVVNSGISTWTLLNLYERGKWIDGASLPLTDPRPAIPEASKDINAVLSEARWNIEFMLSMQIPKSKKVFAPVGDQSADHQLKLTEIDAQYMAFHKVADEVWTAMPMPPHLDREARYVGQPSTAATLNLAAIAAQCARIWKEIDNTFSARCLNAAELAWQAAQKHPDIYAYDNFTGSGPYDDKALSDEFYWAATELFITTGEAKYKAFISKSPHFLETPKGDIKSTGDMFWQYTAPMATISLAVVPNKLTAKEVKQAQQAIINSAKKYQQQIAQEGYRIPYSVEEYPWGSNSNLVNRGIFLIYAADFTGDKNFVKAAASGMDYLLGANPMGISYITGYGSYYAQNPHHRFWAKAADENSPAPAPGALIGGPNSISFSDPITTTLKGKCIQQTCYRDKISAWTVNEITINWNAPLVWLTSALDEGKLN